MRTFFLSESSLFLDYFLNSRLLSEFLFTFWILAEDGPGTGFLGSHFFPTLISGRSCWTASSHQSLCNGLLFSLFRNGWSMNTSKKRNSRWWQLFNSKSRQKKCVNLDNKFCSKVKFFTPVNFYWENISINWYFFVR